jgi:hypothetical protein
VSEVEIEPYWEIVGMDRDQQLDEFTDSLCQLIADHGLKFPVIVCWVSATSGNALVTRISEGASEVLAQHSESEKFGPPLNIMVVSQTNNKTLLISVERDRGMVLRAVR